MGFIQRCHDTTTVLFKYLGWISEWLFPKIKSQFCVLYIQEMKKNIVLKLTNFNDTLHSGFIQTRGRRNITATVPLKLRRHEMEHLQDC